MQNRFGLISGGSFYLLHPCVDVVRIMLEADVDEAFESDSEDVLPLFSVWDE